MTIAVEFASQTIRHQFRHNCCSNFCFVLWTHRKITKIVFLKKQENCSVKICECCITSCENLIRQILTASDILSSCSKNVSNCSKSATFFNGRAGKLLFVVIFLCGSMWRVKFPWLTSKISNFFEFSAAICSAKSIFSSNVFGFSDFWLLFRTLFDLSVTTSSVVNK